MSLNLDRPSGLGFWKEGRPKGKPYRDHSEEYHTFGAMEIPQGNSLGYLNEKKRVRGASVGGSTSLASFKYHREI
jgi:hypothetical protein